MNNNLVRKIAVCSGALVALLLFVSAAHAVSLPGGEALFETSLQDRISSTDTMMTLAANSVRGSQTISGYHCFTLDEGRSDSEYVCGTVSGTTVSGLERGLSLVSGTTTIASLQVQHRKGADVKITDFPLIQRLRNVLNASEGLPGPIYYATHPTFTSNTQLVDLQQLNSTAFGSVPVIVPSGGTGVITLPAMLLQGHGTGAITGTSSPSVAAIFATSTATSTFAGPVNNTYAGASTSTFSGNVAVNGSLAASATTTIAASGTTTNALILNGNPYRFPASQGASSTVLMTDGNGSLSYGLPSPSTLLGGGSIAAGTTTVTIPANTFKGTARLHIQWSFSNVTVGVAFIQVGTGSASTTVSSVSTCFNDDCFGTRDIVVDQTAANKEVLFGLSANSTGALFQQVTLAWTTTNNAYVSFGITAGTGHFGYYSVQLFQQ